MNFFWHIGISLTKFLRGCVWADREALAAGSAEGLRGHSGGGGCAFPDTRGDMRRANPCVTILRTQCARRGGRSRG